MLSQDEIDAIHQAQRARLSILEWMDADTGIYTTFELMGLDPFRATRGQWDRARTIREQIVYGMENATVLPVPEELCQIVSTYAPTYPDARVNSADVLVPHGWAHFTSSIADPQHSDELPIKAMLWWTYRVADLPAYDPGDVPLDQYSMTLVGFIDTADLPGATPQKLARLPQVLPAVSVMWDLDVPDGGNRWDVSITVYEKDYTRQPYVRAMQALWATLRQRMTQDTATEDVVSKPLARYARQRGRTVSQSARVLRLSLPRPRKEVQNPGSGKRMEDRRWSAGHWRNQWFPATRVHRPKLILPYLRGPWDAPIVSGQEKLLLPPKPLKNP